MALNLPAGATSATIYVQVDSTTNKVQFSSSATGPWVAGPINWSPATGNDTPLAATFMCGSGVYGMKTKTDNITVQQVLASVSATASSGDAFTICKSDGTGEDPQIVVTPQ